jgi:ABC-type multidrug transport system ATPase subunit
MSPPHTTTEPDGADAPLLVATGLVKRFRRVKALDGVDVALRAGEALALLGPNGAGKTSLLTILAGVSRPTAGSLTWRPDAAQRVGWAPQRPALYPRLTTRENLRLFAAMEGAPDPDAAAERLLARADLAHVADRLAHELSTGTLQRLNLAISLAGRPSVLLVDEPTATLSPDQRRRLWDWLAGLRREEGLALLFSTQSVEEAAREADRMLVLANGRVVFEGDLAHLVAATGNGEAPSVAAAEEAFLRLVGLPA